MPPVATHLRTHRPAQLAHVLDFGDVRTGGSVLAPRKGRMVLRALPRTGDFMSSPLRKWTILFTRWLQGHTRERLKTTDPAIRESFFEFAAMLVARRI